MIVIRRGTASQAIRALEARGYLIRQRSQADGRSVTLRLTDKGNEVIARDPFEVLVRARGLARCGRANRDA
jgi:DNA-binding MarR family transcriptional regulator